jgi:carbonic anhydrase/acetyltransferase-like protein (isoleucine patch superfamily)
MISTFEKHRPRLGQGAWVAPSAQVLGQVTLGDGANVWYGTVLRGDVGTIVVGARTNVQDLSMIHVTTELHNTVLGDDITVGHRVILHGCSVANEVLVGMGAILLDGVQVGEQCIVGAGATITQGKVIPPRSLVLGSPARVVRTVSDNEIMHIRASAAHYVELAGRHAASVTCIVA